MTHEQTSRQPLLFSAYFPPLSYFCRCLGYAQVRIDACETFPKQTYRNRCHILGANGLLPLVVPVIRTSGNHTPTAAIEIEYSANWPDNHLRAMESAYRSSPFFEYYFDDIDRIIKQKFSHLRELNEHIFEFACDAIGVSCQIMYVPDFVPYGQDGFDFRPEIHPKPQRRQANNAFKPSPYYQVFAAKYGFMPDLSIIDLLMNEGPQSLAVLKSSVVRNCQ